MSEWVLCSLKDNMAYLLYIYIFSAAFTAVVMAKNIQASGTLYQNDILAFLFWTFIPVINSIAPCMYCLAALTDLKWKLLK